jgi:hypothetical protein
MEPGDKKLMAKRILGDYPDEYMSMLEFIDQYPQLQETPAQFQERCGQIALKCFWREQEEEKKTHRDLPDSEDSGGLAGVDWHSERECEWNSVG